MSLLYYRIHIYGYDGQADYWMTHDTYAKNSAGACDNTLDYIRQWEGWPEWVKPRVWKIELLPASTVDDEVVDQPDE